MSTYQNFFHDYFGNFKLNNIIFPLSPQIILFHPLHIFTFHTVALYFARSGLKENAEDTVIVHDVLGKALFTFMYVSLLMPAMPERRRMLIRLPSTRQVWRRVSR